MLFNHNGADAPSLLERNSLLEVVEYWKSVYLSRYPLLSLFPEKVEASEQFMWEIVYELLRVGQLEANPGPGRRMDLERYSASVGKVFYQAYKFTLDTKQAISLREPGRAQLIYGQDVAADAARKLTQQLARNVAIYWRTLHKVCAQILSEAAPTINLSGTSATINYGLTVTTTDNDWTDPSTDVLTEWNTIITNFARENDGLMPNTFIRPPFFHRDVILTNDELRANFAPLMPNIMNGVLSPLSLLMENASAAMRDIQVLDAVDTNGTGTFSDFTDVFPAGKFCLAYLDPATEENLQMITSRNADNDYAGGMNSYTEDFKAPVRTEVHIVGNHIPTIKQPRRVKIVDYIP